MNDSSDYDSLLEKFSARLQDSPPLHFSSHSEILVINEDKLFKILIQNQEKLKSRTSWIAPLGIFLTSASAFLTVDQYKVIPILTPGTLQAIFLLIAFLCAIWLGLLWRSMFEGIRSLFQRTGSDVEVIIEEIKEGSEELKSSYQKSSPSALNTIFLDAFRMAYTGSSTAKD